MANFVYIRQKGLLGNATPVLNAEHLIGDEPFMYVWADDFISASPSKISQMIDVYNRTGSGVVSCIEVKDDEDYNRYGIVKGEEVEDGLVKMSLIVEKPGKESAPSNLASVSGYLFTPDIFDFIHAAQHNVVENEEFKIQPAMTAMIESGHDLYALKIKDGVFYDTGDKLEYLKTVIDFGLQNPEVKDGLMDYLRSVIK
jgi:UTP--glucose-1-phosphate uridylyltransferase